MNGTTSTITRTRYEGSHRDDSFAAARRCRRRDNLARVFGQRRNGRHAAESRGAVAA